jgi:hypothetical protein
MMSFSSRHWLFLAILLICPVQALAGNFSTVSKAAVKFGVHEIVLAGDGSEKGSGCVGASRRRVANERVVQGKT